MNGTWRARTWSIAGQHSLTRRLLLRRAVTATLNLWCSITRLAGSYSVSGVKGQFFAHMQIGRSYIERSHKVSEE